MGLVLISRCPAAAAKAGGDLLFQCLSISTIGAVWFHGRVRDGTGWGTDAMATSLWGRCGNKRNEGFLKIGCTILVSDQAGPSFRAAAGALASAGDDGANS